METRPCRQPSNRSPPRSLLRVPTERREGAHRIQSASFRTGVKEMLARFATGCPVVSSTEGSQTIEHLRWPHDLYLGVFLRDPGSSELREALLIIGQEDI